MSEAQEVFKDYLNLLLKKKITRGKLDCYFSFTNLDINLKKFELVTKDIDDKNYGKLIVAIRNEWNSIKTTL